MVIKYWRQLTILKDLIWNIGEHLSTYTDQERQKDSTSGAGNEIQGLGDARESGPDPQAGADAGFLVHYN